MKKYDVIVIGSGSANIVVDEAIKNKKKFKLMLFWEYIKNVKECIL